MLWRNRIKIQNKLNKFEKIGFSSMFSRNHIFSYFKYLIAFILLIIIGCTDKGVEPPLVEQQEGYPLDVGNWWKYERLVINLDSLGNQLDTSRIDQCEAEIIIGEQVIEEIETVILRTKLIENNREYITDNWYANQNDGLWCYAYRNAGGGFAYPAPPIHRNKGSIYIKGKKLAEILKESEPFSHSYSPSSADNDSIIIEQPPVLCVPYPTIPGYRWNYRDYDNPFLISKVVENQQTIEISFGRIRCNVLRWQYDMDEDRQFDEDFFIIDWIAVTGLVKREITLLNAVVTDDLGVVVDTVSFREKYLLKECNLK